MKILLIVKSEHNEAANYARQVAKQLIPFGGKLFVLEEQMDVFNGIEVSPYKEKSADLILSIGGDGTILKAAQTAIKEDIPILGINVGRLGFMAGAEPGETTDLKRLFSGDYKESRRLLLEAEYPDGEGTKTVTALNDLLITKASLHRLIEADIVRNGQKVITYRSDSILFSTPTGSTAYSLSNGGPIADPELSYFAMSPICPHSLMNRTILFQPDVEISVYLQSTSLRPAEIVADGKVLPSTLDRRPIILRKSQKELRMIVLNSRRFYQLIADKFSTYP